MVKEINKELKRLDLIDALSETLANKPEDLLKALEMLKNIRRAWRNNVVPAIDELIVFLESRTIAVKDIPEFVKRMNKTYEKEVNK